MRKRKGPYRWPGLDQRFPRQSRCPKCGSETLVGVRDAWPIVFDRWHLTQWGECEALLNGHEVYELHEPHMYRRSARRITENPKHIGGVLVRTHICGKSAPGARSIEPPRSHMLPTECPF